MLNRHTTEPSEEAMRLDCSSAVLRDEQSRQQVQALENRAAAGKSRSALVVDSLQRLTAFRGRGMRPTPRGEASIRVRAPRDLQIEVERPCHLHFVPTNADIRAHTEHDTHDIVEWETLTKALLSMHLCIRRFSLHIIAVPWPPGQFYQCFDLRDGTALVVLHIYSSQVDAMVLMGDNNNYVRQLRMQQGPAIYGNYRALLPSQVIDGHPELKERFSRILKSTVDMPFLEAISMKIYATLQGPSRTVEMHERMAYEGYSELRRLVYKLDGSLTPLVKCKNANIPGVSTEIGADRTIHHHQLLACRELTGFTAHVYPFLVTLTHKTSPHDYDITMWARL